jgi:hypothetical protein
MKIVIKLDPCRPATRAVQVILGIILGLISLFLGLCCLIMLYHYSIGHSNPPRAGWVIAAVLIIAAMMGQLAFRLLTGRGRKGSGGLLSPTTLRIGGALFVLGAALQLKKSILRFDLALLHLAAAGACFSVATRRVRIEDQNPPGVPHDS